MPKRGTEFVGELVARPPAPGAGWVTSLNHEIGKDTLSPRFPTLENRAFSSTDCFDLECGLRGVELFLEFAVAVERVFRLADRQFVHHLSWEVHGSTHQNQSHGAPLMAVLGVELLL